MKLYTEEQVRDMLHEMKCKHNLTDEQIEYWIEDMIPIELPSDEEIEDKADALYLLESNIQVFTKGAKWMRDKILNK